MQQTLTLERERVTEVPQQRSVLRAAEIPADEIALANAQRLIAYAGQTALSEEAEYEGRPRYANLLEALRALKAGDERARPMVTTNVLTDMLERTIKAGHIMNVGYEVDANDKLKQYGQYFDDVNSNALRRQSRNGPMYRRGVAEAHNNSRIELYRRMGLLKDNYLVVFSRAADDMDEKAMQDAGFFTETMSMAIQCTDENSIESAFVAGKPDAVSKRQDGEVIAKVYEELTGTACPATATELLDSPVLIPKEFMPNGVVDLVRMYDDEAGTFFGQYGDRQDYATFSAVCARREATYQTRVDKVVRELVRRVDELESPEDAFELLGKLSEANMVDHALTDLRINPMVFGPEAAYHLAMAREALQTGDEVKFKVSRQRAHETADSKSCPTARRKAKEAEAADDDDPDSKGKESDNDEKSESSSEACDYVHTGCYCCPYDNSGRPLSTRQPVRAYRDSRGTARCMRTGCGAVMDKNGKVSSKGGIYRRAMERLVAQKMAKEEYELAA